jgi:hypothetical protein
VTGRQNRAEAWLMSATLLWSAAWSVLALWWTLAPGSYVLDAPGSDEPTSLPMILPPEAGSALFLALGLVGMMLAVLLARVRRGQRGRVPVLVTGAAYAAFFGLLVPDIQLLSFLGYPLALFGGPILIVILIAGARRHRWNLVVLLVIATVIGIGVVLGEIGKPILDLLREIRGGVARVGPRPIVLAIALVGGLLFAATTVTAARRGAPSRTDAARARSAERLQRWGRAATIVAAICPLPYALIRLTWLTPWPQGLGPGHNEMLDEVRLFGVALGLAALGGAWLTLGLILRWGEVWPAWLPGLRGRPVPVLAAVVPASLVAVVLCSASVSLVAMAVRAGDPGLVLFIPAPIWGPALALATYAYYQRRTSPQLADGIVGTDQSHPSSLLEVDLEENAHFDLESGRFPQDQRAGQRNQRVERRHEHVADVFPAQPEHDRIRQSSSDGSE